MSLQGHSVQFYNDDMFLTQSVARFITEGLQAGDKVIIVATAWHREELQKVLTLGQMLHDKLQFFDAEAQLAKFMIKDWPSESRFRHLVQGMIGPTRLTGPVRIFGEMVAVLWAKGYTRAALRLEELWNNLMTEESFALHCAYPLSKFSEDNESLLAISRLHSQVHSFS